MLNALAKRTVIGPPDEGRKMTLEQFDSARGQEGYLYELNKGVIEVTDVPHPRHFALLQEVRDQLVAYRLTHPDAVHSVMGSNESKILLATDQSERHPDISVYLSPPPNVEDVWSLWIPAIVVEVVSKSSAKRDYQDKPSEYLSFGIDEYWIVDGSKNQMTALTRWRGQWQEKILKPAQKHATRHLPGFSLDLKRVFAIDRRT
jgi:Uma2 family endonuclease